MKLDAKREHLIAEITSDPARQAQLRRILRAQDAAVERERRLECALFWFQHLPQSERDVLVAIEEAHGAVGLGTVEEIEAALFDSVPETAATLAVLKAVKRIGRGRIAPGTVALLSAVFTGHERGAAAGKAAGKRIVGEAHQFAAAYSRDRLPFHADDAITSFDALVDELRARGLESADMDDTEDEIDEKALMKLAAMREGAPETTAAHFRWLLTRSAEERQQVYEFANRFWALLFASFRTHFPDRDPAELWEHTPASDEFIRAQIAALDASVQ